MIKKYWKSVEEFQGITSDNNGNSEEKHKNELQEMFEDGFLRKSSSRRDFLKVLGFSLAFNSHRRRLQKAGSECYTRI